MLTKILNDNQVTWGSMRTVKLDSLGLWVSLNSSPLSSYENDKVQDRQRVVPIILRAALSKLRKKFAFRRAMCELGWGTASVRHPFFIFCAPGLVSIYYRNKSTIFRPCCKPPRHRIDSAKSNQAAVKSGLKAAGISIIIWFIPENPCASYNADVRIAVARGYS